MVEGLIPMIGNIWNMSLHSSGVQLRRHVKAQWKLEREWRANRECVQCSATYESCQRTWEVWQRRKRESWVRPMFGNLWVMSKHMGSLTEAEEIIGSASNVQQPMSHVKAHEKFDRGGRDNRECVQCSATYESCQSTWEVWQRRKRESGVHPMFGNLWVMSKHMWSLTEAEERIWSASNVRQPMSHVKAHGEFDRGGGENRECVQCSATSETCHST